MTASHGRLSCAEATELAGVYVLDALDADERAEVAHHLATCTLSDHAEFAEIGAVVPALAASVEPIAAPAALRARVLEAYRADTAPVPVAPRAVVPAAPRQERRPWFALPRLGQLAPLAAALLIVAVVGVWGLGARADADRAQQRAAELSSAIAALSAPGSAVAILHGSGPAAPASGFAAFPAQGGGYVVMVDLPSAPAGRTYQAWYIADGAPASAGLLSVGSDGYAVLSGAQAIPGTHTVALTLEPSGGSAAPTSDPIVVGEVINPG